MLNLTSETTGSGVDPREIKTRERIVNVLKK